VKKNAVYHLKEANGEENNVRSRTRHGGGQRDNQKQNQEVQMKEDQLDLLDKKK
jgi:hypothetical protein